VFASTHLKNDCETRRQALLAERFAVADGDRGDGGSPNLTPIGRRHD
jgi:hypothetical protein